MKKEFIDIVYDIAPLVFVISVAASFLKGAKSVVEYMKSVIAAYVVGIPSAVLVEYLADPNAWVLKYFIVLTAGAFGICIFNGFFKIFKEFEQHPKTIIKSIRRDKDI